MSDQFFRVRISRTQTQTQFFAVKADDKADLERRLQELDFGDIDGRFDEGEVDSIEYSVLDVKPCEKDSSTFADEALQNLIG